MPEPDNAEGFFARLARPTALRLAGALTALIVLPDLGLYVGVASSEALGTGIVALVFLLCALPMFSRYRQAYTVIESRRRISIGVLALVVLTFIAAHAAIAATFMPFDAGHALASAALAAFVLMAGAAFADVILAADEFDLERVVRWCLALMGVMVVEGILHISPPSADASPIPMFPFTEPSHFAQICGPLLLFAAVRLTGKARGALLAAAAVGGLLLPSFTLLIVVALASAVCLKRSHALLIVLLLVALAPLVDLSYFAARTDFSQSNSNLTALVYVQGWQLVFESLQDSAGWGLGFQQLGIHGTSVPASDMIYAIVGAYGNVLDGGFNFAKIVSEFGALGLVLIVWYVFIAFGALKVLRAAARATSVVRASRLLAGAAILCYSVEVFVRGGGYFTPGSLLFIAALRIWSFAPKLSTSPQAASLAVP